VEDTIIKAAVDDTLHGLKSVARSLWEGGSREQFVKSLAGRMEAVLWLMIMGDEDDEVDRHIDIDWKVVESPEVSRVFKEMVAFIKEKPTLSVFSPKQLDDRVKQTAWYISGVMSKNLLERVQKTLVKAKTQGTSQRQFIQDVYKVIEKSGPEIETIFRTNGGSAAAAGRWQQYNQPEVADMYHAYQYVSKQDPPRSRTLHRLMNGFVAIKADPIWKIIWPVNGYNCRCKVLPLNKRQSVAAGVINEAGHVLQARIHTNLLQQRVVQIAESGEVVEADGRRRSFPDEGFRGNALVF
jgi:SPP1 gp7 family putative phage head morphogenesis protein